MTDLKRDFPDGPRLQVVSLDTTLAIEAGIDEIVVTLFQAVGLVILVTFIFLQNFRATLIPTLAVPVSLVGTFVAFPLLGFSINTLSLLGLVLAIGIVVDDAIVVVEAVTAKMEQGMGAERKRPSSAMKEVSAPIVATSLSLLAVFVPVAFMAGITGRLYQQFAITIAVSVAISSINALTLSPALSALLLRPPGERGRSPLQPFYDGFNASCSSAPPAATCRSRRASSPGDSVMCVALLGGLTVIMAGLFGAVPGGFVPEEDQGYFLVNIQLPDAASLQRTDEVTAQGRTDRWKACRASSRPRRSPATACSPPRWHRIPRSCSCRSRTGTSAAIRSCTCENITRHGQPQTRHRGTGSRGLCLRPAGDSGAGHRLRLQHDAAGSLPAIRRSTLLNRPPRLWNARLPAGDRRCDHHLSAPRCRRFSCARRQRQGPETGRVAGRREYHDSGRFSAAPM